ncbi:MAG: hypothetical protein MJE66_09665, partial [Proteobacteria bacterium]|nr:hypothetical protein [Pseudomonadota bacterium]
MTTQGLTRRALAAAIGGLVSAVLAAGCSEIDGGNDYDWQTVELPGTVCGDGSQYRFFTWDSPASDNLIVFYEGGGACWDHEGCSGKLGLLGAANRNGIPADYIQQEAAKFVSPIVNGADPGLPFRSKRSLVTQGWDVAYFPYCTGDVHVGNRSVTYVDPSGQEPPFAWQHAGLNNSRAGLVHLSTVFPNVDKLLVTGFSAGGVASSILYYDARRTLDPNRGYMLNDSGPVFPTATADANSKPLHERIRESWGLDPAIAEFPELDPEDLGTVNRFVSEEFPDDQFAYTGYNTDFNFSRYSYERLWTDVSQTDLTARWQEDNDDLLDQLDGLPNFSYFVPYNRPVNASHCSTIVSFVGSHAFPGAIGSCNEAGQGGCVSMERFLADWIDNGIRYRIEEIPNRFNLDDTGLDLYTVPLNEGIGLSPAMSDPDGFGHPLGVGFLRVYYDRMHEYDTLADVGSNDARGADGLRRGGFSWRGDHGESMGASDGAFYRVWGNRIGVWTSMADAMQADFAAPSLVTEYSWRGDIREAFEVDGDLAYRVWGSRIGVWTSVRD